jgi:hypothetical protein
VKLPKRPRFGDVNVRLSNIWNVSKERSVFGNLCKMRFKQFEKEAEVKQQNKD